MKKFIILSLVIGLSPLSMMAQDDDLYFTPQPKVKSSSSSSSNTKADEGPAYYCGSNRDVDEYNHRGRFRSHYEGIPGDSTSDVISFDRGTGLYPDTVYTDSTFAEKYEDMADNDYRYSRRMSRFDDFYDPWLYSYYGYGPWGYGRWWWRDPWLYSWYDPWYDPWYYGWGGYYGWGYPYYAYGWGWGYPYYYGWGGWYPGGYAYHGVSGTRGHGVPSYGGNRGFSSSRTGSYTAGTFGGSRMRPMAGTTTTRSTGTRDNTRTYTNQYGNFGGSRQPAPSTRTYTPSVPSSRPSGFGGGGTFGGSRSGGGFGGGGGRSGGGNFGGRR